MTTTTRTFSRMARTALWLLLGTLAGGLQAATFTVNSTLHGTDGNAGTTTLVEAINAANTAGGSNTIELAANTAYVSDDTVFIDGTSAGRTMYPAITSNITIHGNGATLDATGKNARFFYVTGTGALTLERINLVGGKAQGGAGAAGNFGGGGGGAGMGGAIFVNGSTASLTIRQSSILNCLAQGGTNTNWGTAGTTLAGPGGGGGGMGGDAGDLVGGDGGQSGGGGSRTSASGATGGASNGGNAGANNGGFGGGGGGGIQAGNAGNGGFGGGGGGGWINLPSFGAAGTGGFGGGGGGFGGNGTGGAGGPFGGRGGAYNGGGFANGGPGAGLGGAIFNLQGTVVLENVSLLSNTARSGINAPASAINGITGASAVGGGMFNYDGAVTIKHCTFYQNACTADFSVPAPATGGALYNYDASGGSTPSVTIYNSILATSTFTSGSSAGVEAFNDGAGSITAGGTANSNIVTSSTGVTGTVNTASPALSLTARGNGVTGVPPATGSPAINAGDNANSLATDAFGTARIGTVDIGAIEGPLSTSFTLTSGMLLICDTNADAVFAVDPATGNRTLVSKNGFVGTGPDIQNPRGITTDTSGNIYVVNTAPTPVSIVKIDPTNGNRTTISSSAVGTGTNFSTPSGIAFRASDGKLIVTDSGGTNGSAGSDAVFVVDPATGNRTILSDDVTPNTTNALTTPNSLIVHSTLGIFVTDSTTADSVMKVDAGTGARTIFSSATVPDATNPITNPNGIAEDTDGSILLIEAGSPNRQLLRINSSTGTRTVVSTLSTTETFDGVAAGSGGIFVTKSTNPDAVFKVNPSTGVLTLAANNTIGNGVLFGAGGTSAGLNFGIAFYGSAPVTPAPTVTNVSPASGPTTGGSVVSITGTNFTGATAVTIGGTAVTSFHVVNATTIEAVTPAKAAGSASVVVTTAGGSNAANTLFTYNAAVASTVVDFETAATGSLAAGAQAFTSSGKTWTLTGFLIGDPVNALGSSPVGAATPASNGFLDSGPSAGLVARSPGSVGAIVAPAGNTFRAVGIDIWPASNSTTIGGSIIPYQTGINDVPGETGHTFNVKGYRNGSVVVNVNVIDTLRTPPQSGSVAGGYWHHLEFTNSAFDTTDIDKLEFFIVTQSGTAFDGPNSGSALSTPNYIALDNFVYSSLTVAAPNLTINDVSLNEGNAGTTNFTFTVSLSAPAPAGGVTFDIATADGTATSASGDYVAKSLTAQTIPAGSSTYSFTVLVNGDTAVEPNETFFVNVTNVTGAIVTDGQGQGTIVNDDVAGPATHFTVTAPANAAAGSPFSVTVTALDAANNVATSYTGTVHFTKTDSGAGSSVPANYTFAAGDNGVHTFTNGATLVTAGTQTLTATDTVTGSINGTSGNVAVSAAAATHFSVSAPANATAGSAFNVTVTALDQFNNTATGYAGTVHFTSSDGTATLPGNSTLTSGTGTFSATLRTAGSQTVTATDTVAGSINGTSGSVTVSAAAATHLAFGVQPASTVAGVAISPAVTVQVLDQFNNLVTTDTSNVTVAIGTNPGGGTLSGTATVAAVGGVATFSTLSINKAGTGYTLTASDGALTGATSGAFNITPAAANHLAFGVQPASTVAGVAISPAVTVQVLDQFNNLVTTDTSNVTVAIGTNPGGGALSGTATVAAVGGVATFSTLSINKAGTGYTLTASDGALTGATSSGFNVTAGAANHFAVTAPANAAAGTAFSVTVTAQDQFNNTVTGYTGTVHFTTTDPSPGVAVPADYAFTGGDGGMHTFTNGVTFVTAGNQTVTATDTVTGSINGTSSAVTVAPVPPTVNTPTSASLTANSAVLGGNVASGGGTSVSAVGVLVSTNAGANFTLPAGSGVNNLTGSVPTVPGAFTASATGLSASTQYYFVAYATNSAGTTYTTPVATFTTPAPDYTVATAGNAITVTDVSGNSDTLAVFEATPGTIRFTATGRTFSVDGAVALTGDTGDITLTGVSGITVNAGGGDDVINVSAFTGTNFPSLTINGGTGNDLVNLTGSITFAANANLDLDLQNDSATPGTDIVGVATNAHILTSGTGTITVKVSQKIELQSGSSLETVDGGITLEANQQAVATAGSFVGVQLIGGTVQATGTGAVTVTGRGGNGVGGAQHGVSVGTASVIRGGTGAIATVTGIGGATAGASNFGILVDGSGVITSLGANVTVIGQGGGTAASTLNRGVQLGNAFNNTSLITAGGGGTVTVQGTGGLGTSNSYGVRIALGGGISSTGGDVFVTGIEGSGPLSLGISNNSATGAITVGGGKSLTMTADTMDLATISSITANAATLVPRTAGRLVNLGSAVDNTANTLELSAAELNKITCSALVIGDANSGAITQSTAITRSAVTDVTFNSGSTIAINTGPLNTAGGNLVVNPGGATNTFGPLAVGTDVNMGATGTLSFGSGDQLAVTIDGTTPDSQFTQLKVTGKVDLTGAALSVGGSYTPASTDTFTIIDNDGADAVAGTFAGLPEGASLTLNGKSLLITYHGGDGNDVVLIANRPPVPGPVFAARGPTTSVKIPIAQFIAAAPDPDAGDIVTLVSVGNPAAPAHGTAVISGSNVIYTPAPGNTTGVTFSYTVTDNHGAQATGTVTVTVNGTPGATSVQITKMTRATDGSVSLTFAGVPGYTYGLQFTDDLLNPWQNLGPVPMNAVGQATFTDGVHNASPNVFYRFIYPAP